MDWTAPNHDSRPSEPGRGVGHSHRHGDPSRFGRLDESRRAHRSAAIRRGAERPRVAPSNAFVAWMSELGRSKVDLLRWLRDVERMVSFGLEPLGERAGESERLAMTLVVEFAASRSLSVVELSLLLDGAGRQALEAVAWLRDGASR